MQVAEGICYIVGAGEMSEAEIRLQEGDFLIACDGGLVYCQEKSLQPHLVVGDFDSLGYVPEAPNLIHLNVEKDETDTGWAVREGWQRGYRRFVIYGGTGGRNSHTIANIQLLASLAAKGGKGVLRGKKCWYQVISNQEICFDETEKGMLSVFCLGDQAEGVFESGLKYELEDAILTKENPIGVSNEFTGTKSRVAVRKGTLLLIGEAI